jgi:S-DNA-T family DNA segregation ATPase FtsK/SpoIIIE
MPRKRRQERTPLFEDLSPQAKQGIGAVIFAVLGIFFALSSMGYSGFIGDLTHSALRTLFGYGFVLAPITCLLYVITLLRPRIDTGTTSTSKMVGIFLLFLSALALLSLLSKDLGGFFGWALEAPLSYLLGSAASGIVIVGIFLISIFLTFNIGLSLPRRAQEDTKKKRLKPDADDEEEGGVTVPILKPTHEEALAQIEEPESDEPAVPKKSFTEKVFGASGAPAGEFLVTSFSGTYAPPPLSLLERDKGKGKSGDVKANANIIKRTLEKFGIEVEMDEVTIGPSVTRYAMKPAEGVRLAKIVSLQSNLELALAASPLRIEAPIPGKSLVGIEVPNTAKATVGLASLLATPEYTDSPKPLLVALGRDIAGAGKFANLAKMPHLLIAGATGSGKSVTIQAIITSLLFRNSPDQLRFIMVDPKRVELTNYNGIPHLLTPVITDAKKTIMALKWATKEMERRYEILQAEAVRDIDTYHEKAYKPEKKKFDALPPEEQTDDAKMELPEPMPYILIFIDELADIMQAYPRELESSIVRLAQMSRAVGIHLILATQRPEVKVITGLIKANVPGRIALRVASQIDSRTIIDQPGAEKLLGSGDMLFLSSDTPKPVRLQSAYLSDAELHQVVGYLKKQAANAPLDSLDLSGNAEKSSDVFLGVSMDDDDVDDDLYEEVKQTVIATRKASTSFLQRKFGIGYSRAAKLIDTLESKGVIGPGQGSKPRDVLIGGGTGASNDEQPPEALSEEERI